MIPVITRLDVPFLSAIEAMVGTFIDFVVLCLIMLTVAKETDCYWMIGDRSIVVNGVSNGDMI